MKIWTLLTIVIILTVIIPKYSVSNQVNTEQIAGGHCPSSDKQGCLYDHYRHPLGGIYSNKPCRQPSCQKCGLYCKRNPDTGKFDCQYKQF